MRDLIRSSTCILRSYITGDIIDTYVYRLGIQQAQYSVGAAIGLFKSAVSAVLVLTSYILADKCAGYKIF